MDSLDWQAFLRQWSEMVLKADKVAKNLPADVVESRWLGFPAATEDQIRKAEARLGGTLPASYRTFLGVTNGWRLTVPFVYKLWSTEEVEWFNRRHFDWINAYLEEGNNGNTTVPDSEYLIYGEGQSTLSFRPEYLRTALEISAEGDSAIYLLNPRITTADGEWEGWFFSNWFPGARRFRSFAQMMQAEYKRTRRFVAISWT